MSLQTALNFAKLSAAYVREGKTEQAMASAMYMLDHMEKAGILPDDFDAIQVNQVHHILPTEVSANAAISELVRQAVE